MSIIIYIIQILNIIKDSFKKLHMKSLRFASTKRIWKAIFIEETRSLCYAPSGIPKYFRRKCMSNLYFLGRNAHSWFFTHRDTSRFFQGELRPFDDQRNRRLTENFAWFGSIQGLEINAQTWRLGVRLRSCGTPQTRKFLALWGRETGRGQQSPHAWRPCPTVKGSADY